MKNLKFVIIALLAVIMSSVLSAQVNTNAVVKTETINVSGNCGMCKSRIEKAAKLEGVSKATWNQDSHKLVVTYNSSKVNIDDIQKNIAAVGHDTDKFKADAKVYDKLPSCCKYR